MEKELIDFLKYVKEVHVDAYGHLEICDSGDELDPTVEKVVKDYLKSKEIQSGGGMVDATISSQYHESGWVNTVTGSNPVLTTKMCCSLEKGMQQRGIKPK